MKKDTKKKSNGIEFVDAKIWCKSVNHLWNFPRALRCGALESTRLEKKGGCELIVGCQTDRVVHCNHPESQFTSSQCLIPFNSFFFVVRNTSKNSISTNFTQAFIFLNFVDFCCNFAWFAPFPRQAVRIDTHYFLFIFSLSLSLSLIFLGVFVMFGAFSRLNRYFHQRVAQSWCSSSRIGGGERGQKRVSSYMKWTTNCKHKQARMYCESEYDAYSLWHIACSSIMEKKREDSR